MLTHAELHDVVWTIASIMDGDAARMPDMDRVTNNADDEHAPYMSRIDVPIGTRGLTLCVTSRQSEKTWDAYLDLPAVCSKHGLRARHTIAGTRHGEAMGRDIARRLLSMSNVEALRVDVERGEQYERDRVSSVAWIAQKAQEARGSLAVATYFNDVAEQSKYSSMISGTFYPRYLPNVDTSVAGVTVRVLVDTEGNREVSLSCTDNRFSDEVLTHLLAMCDDIAHANARRDVPFSRDNR